MKAQRKDILWPVWVLSIVFFAIVVAMSVLDSPGALLLTSTDPVYVQSSTTITTGSVNPLINLNSATKEELLSLHGIGNTLAERILSYRAANGSFERIEDLLNVAGIGETLLEQLRPFIEV